MRSMVCEPRGWELIGISKHGGKEEPSDKPMDVRMNTIGAGANSQSLASLAGISTCPRIVWHPRPPSSASPTSPTMRLRIMRS